MGTTLRQSLLIAGKDTKVFFKDRFAVGFSFLFPFLFVIGFSLALSGQGPTDSQLVITAASQEESGLSQEILNDLSQSDEGAVRVVEYSEALDELERGDIEGFVAFPADFTQGLFSGQPVVLEVVVGSGSVETEAALTGFARSVAGNVSVVGNALGAIQEIAAGNQAVIQNADMTALSRGPAPVIGFEVERVGDIRPFKASNFTLPGYLTMFVFFAAALSAEAIARERQTHTLERLMSNGTRRESIILGKFIGAVYRGVMQLVVMWTVGIFAFKIDLGVSPSAVVLLSILMALAAAAFGVLLASFVRDVKTATTAGVLVSLTLAPLGGSWWPLFITPQWMQSLAKLTPHGWANGGFNKLMLFGAEFGDVSQEMIALAAFATVFLTIALWRFRVSAA